ncbi:gem-associated protein 7-like isoform X1 [Cylas formicarius]|uniref:gem-associated protein 7-like isoform X1 n=1 Tax=Cylas formicarius TaxID=197179 RepID=UPI00295842C1|nr:gem-associated protein 7-like isoform X1 [Cylas formicarius]
MSEGNAGVTEEQEAAAFLREKFLYFISTLPGAGKTCKIRMYDNTEVTAQLKAFDANFDHVVVENLKTHLPQPLKKAILRTSDVISISYDTD